MISLSCFHLFFFISEGLAAPVLNFLVSICGAAGAMLSGLSPPSLSLSHRRKKKNKTRGKNPTKTKQKKTQQKLFFRSAGSALRLLLAFSIRAPPMQPCPRQQCVSSGSGTPVIDGVVKGAADAAVAPSSGELLSAAHGDAICPGFAPPKPPPSRCTTSRGHPGFGPLLGTSAKWKRIFGRAPSGMLLGEKRGRKAPGLVKHTLSGLTQGGGLG